MKVAFLGHRRLAVGALRAIRGGGHQLVAVVTHHPEACPGEDLWLSEAEAVAREAGACLLQPKRLAGSPAARELAETGADVWVVVGYLEILSAELLAIPPRGAVNFHAALLPRYRGRAPLSRALMNGERTVGATLHFVDERMDAGDIIAQVERPVSRTDTVVTLYDWAAEIAPELVRRGLRDLAEDRVERRPQREEASLTYGELTSRDRMIDWAWPAERIHDQIRALTSPWPGALTHYRGEVMLVLSSEPPDPADRDRGADPGRVLALSERGALVQTGQGLIWLVRVQRDHHVGSEHAASCIRRPGVRLGLSVESRLLRLEHELTELQAQLGRGPGRTRER